MKAMLGRAWRWVRRQKWWVQALIGFVVLVVVMAPFTSTEKGKEQAAAAAPSTVGTSAPTTPAPTTAAPPTTTTPPTTVTAAATEAPCALMASDGSCIADTIADATSTPPVSDPPTTAPPEPTTTVNQFRSPTDNGRAIVDRVGLLLLDEPALADDERVQGQFAVDYYEGTVGVDRTLILGMSFNVDGAFESTRERLIVGVVNETKKRAAAMLHAAERARSQGVEFDVIQIEISSPYIIGQGLVGCCETVTFKAKRSAAARNPNPWCAPWEPVLLLETDGARDLRALASGLC